MRILIVTCIVACGARSELGVPLGSTHADGGITGDGAISGACGPTLQTLAMTAVTPDAIAIDDAFIYFHDHDGIFRLPKSGGSPSLLLKTASVVFPDLSSFAVGGGYVYGNDDSGNVIGVSLANGPQQSLPFGSDYRFAADTSSLVLRLWSSDIGAATIFAWDLLPNTASPPGVPLKVDHSPSKMVFDSGRAFTAANPGISVLDFASSTSTLLSGLPAGDLAVDGTRVFFTSDDATNGARVLVLSTDTLHASPIPETFGAFALAQDTSDLYFTDAVSERVRRIVGKNGSVIDVASFASELTPVDLALDDKCIYVTVSAGTTMPGSIVSVAKP